MACGAAFADSTGALVGRVQSLTGAPMAGALVIVSWTDFDVDRKTALIVTRRLTANVRADTAGVYRACGLPVQRSLHTASASAGTDVQSGIVEEQIGSTHVHQRDFTVSRAAQFQPFDSTRSLAIGAVNMPAIEVAAVAADTTRALGRYALTGNVQGPDGTSVRSAQVRLFGTNRATTTNDGGDFRLTGIPAGTQGFEVVALGYYPRRVRFDIADGALPVVFRLEKAAAVLDSIRVIATRVNAPRALQYKEFDDRRHTGLGAYFTESDIQRRQPFEASELFRMTPGVRVDGWGEKAMLMSTRGAANLKPGGGLHAHSTCISTACACRSTTSTRCLPRRYTAPRCTRRPRCRASISRHRAARFFSGPNSEGTVKRVMAAVLLLAANAGAQGAIQGTAYDSVARRPLVGATVIATPMLARADTVFHSAISDAAGHFVIGRLNAGRYTVSVEHPWIDSTGVGAPTQVADVPPRGDATVALAIPSRSTLRKVLCPDAAEDPSLGVMLGTVRYLDGRAALGATVVLSWGEFDVDRTSASVNTRQLNSGTIADSLGVYRACGGSRIAAGTLFVQAQGAGRAVGCARGADWRGRRPGARLHHRSGARGEGGLWGSAGRVRCERCGEGRRRPPGGQRPGANARHAAVHHHQ